MWKTQHIKEPCILCNTVCCLCVMKPWQELNGWESVTGQRAGLDLTFKEVYNPFLSWMQCCLSSLEYNAWMISKVELMPKCFIMSHWCRVHSKIHGQTTSKISRFTMGNLWHFAFFKLRLFKDILEFFFPFLCHYFWYNGFFFFYWMMKTIISLSINFMDFSLSEWNCHLFKLLSD